MAASTGQSQGLAGKRHGSDPRYASSSGASLQAGEDQADLILKHLAVYDREIIYRDEMASSENRIERDP